MAPPFPRSATAIDLFTALDALERGRVTVAVVQAVQSAPRRERRALARALLRYAPRTRLLLALLRPRLTAAVAAAGGGRSVRCAVSWVRQSSPAAFAALRAGPPELAPALRAHGDDLLAAWRALEVGLGDAVGTRVPHGRAVAAAVALLRAWRGEASEDTLRGAAAGDVAAVRALALLPEADGRVQERALDVLLTAQRTGTRPAARAAADALLWMATRRGITVAHLAQRAALAAAWPDAGFDGKRARVWTVAPYTLRLQVRAGKPMLSVHSARGARRGVPAAVRRSPAFDEARAAMRDLRAMVRRFAARFETAMITQEAWPARTLAVLRANPVVADVCDRLVWSAGEAFGVFDEGVLCDLDGAPLAADSSHPLTVAHPAALAARGLLGPWQHRWLSRETPQPFRQLLREVYHPDAADEVYCCRFAGRPLVARRAYALLRARGWAPGSGCAQRLWPDAGVRACLVWAVERRAGRAAGTQAGVVTTGPLSFERLDCDEVRAPSAPLRVSGVPVWIVSEALRDFDLIVARAGVGEADLTPQETTRFRGALLRDLARLHGLRGIVVGDGEHALIDAPAGRLRLHLGTGTVHREPDGSHWPQTPAATQGVLPVRAAGPETAEILALAVSLARGDRTAE